MSTQKLTKKVTSALVALWVLAPPALAHADEPIDVLDGAKVTITQVVSGHEFKGKLEDGTRVTVRVMGIDCPDGKSGERATKAAKKLTQKKTITLESTHESFPLLQDNTGRLVGYVRTADGGDLATSMIQKGLCTSAMWKINHPRKVVYAQLGK